MAIQPIFASVRTKKTAEFIEQVKAECKTDIPSDAVARVLDVRAFCGGANFSEEDKKASGTVIFNVIYLSEDGIKKYECAQSFSRELSASSPVLSVKTEKATADVSGTRLSLSAILTINVASESACEFPALTGGEGIIAEERTVTVKRGLGLKKATFPAETEKTFPYEIAEVLFQQATAYVTEVQCGVGSIICDGEVNVSALFLQNSENGDIIREETTFPFRYELESDETMPANFAKAEVSVKSVRSDISVDAENGKSAATVQVTLDIFGETYVEETQTVITDAFSLTDKTETERSLAVLPAYAGYKNVKIKVSGKSGGGVPAGAEIIAVIKENAETVSVKTDKGISLKGVYSAKVLYKDAENKTGSYTVEIPFDYKEDKSEEYDAAEIKVYALSPSVRAASDTETEVNGEVAVCVRYIKNEKAEFLSDIRSVGEKQVCSAAISVYIALEGEGLFSLAKRLNVSPESLTETNRELTFPLCGKERIVVYRQK